MSAKVPATVRLAKQALMEDKCVVIGLQSTGEARTEEAVTKYVRIWVLFYFLVKQFCFPHFSFVTCFFFIILDRVLNLMTLFLVLENCC